ncbi:hypothetical protein Bca4012_020677 [Brassica carinata]|uniref:Uncharacterized protein n=1 Tax=Brassica carinata TaxID=52824 RepID=A0A8X7WFG8_BRACI|nr:hypothetical protein Bca52824_000969 [Brassica carinata]
MTNSSIYYVTQPPPSGFLDVEKELQKIGLKSVRNTAKRRVAAQIQGISQKNGSKPQQHTFSVSLPKPQRQRFPELNLIDE